MSISRYARGAHEGFRVYSALAPGAWFKSVSREEYIQRFTAQLAALDPRQVWDELHALANGAEPVMLCWEVPPWTDRNWCHRRMVAEWLERELGVEIPELTPGDLKGQPPAPPRPPPPPPAGQMGFSFAAGAPMNDGDSVIVAGSKGATYTVTNRKGVLFCSCLSFRFNGARHTCKHVVALIQAPAELVALAA